MTLKNILEIIGKYNSTSVIILIVVLSFVEVSKIPLNPWKFVGSLFKKMFNNIGDALNHKLYVELDEIKDNQKKINEKINSLEDNQNSFKLETEKEFLKDKRSKVFKFYNECYRGINHSKEEFDDIIETYHEYEERMDLRGYTNGKAENAFQYIMDQYHENEKNHTFI